MNIKAVIYSISRNSEFVFSVVWISIVFYFVFRHTHHGDQESSINLNDIRCEVDNTIRCENGGLLVRTEDGYACDCSRGYSGENCTESTQKQPACILWLKRVIDRLLSISADDVNEIPGKVTGWSIWPFASDLQELQKNTFTFYQNKMKRLSTLMTYSSSINNNRESLNGKIMTDTRILPPARPLQCAPLQNYPPRSVLYDKIFQRDTRTFLPDERRRNLLFHTFYQYFVLQFFDADFNPSVSASQLYGANKHTQRELRSFSGGKLKTELLKNENYPPLLSSVNDVKMVYPNRSLHMNTEWFNRIHTETNRKPDLKWAMGHPLLSMNPMLFAMSTLWVREHNRVCDMLANEYPLWTDGQIYNTAKNIVIGEMMGIMLNEIITVHTGSSIPLKFRPEEYHDHLQNIINFETPLELLLITMWPSSLPEKFRNTSIDSILFSNNSQVFDSGMSDTIKSMINQKMGMVTHNNDGTATEHLTRLMSKLSREYLVQHFNDYRRQLGLRAYKTFFELTGNQETADKLQALYDYVDDVELLPGMLTEKKVNGNSPTATILANSFIVNSILTNSLTSKQSWTPGTFGGNIGFEMVKSANIMSLVCNNLVDNCEGMSVSLYAE